MLSAFKALQVTRRRIGSYTPQYKNDGTGRDFYINEIKT